MLVGRPRTATEIKRLAGTLDRRELERVEIIAEGAPAVPDFVVMTPAEREIFDYLAANCLIPGVHGAADSLALAQLAQALAEREELRAEIRESGRIFINTRTGKPEMHPACQLLAQVESRIRALQVEIGLSATARTRFAQPKPAEQGGLWDDLET